MKAKACPYECIKVEEKLRNRRRKREKEKNGVESKVFELVNVKYIYIYMNESYNNKLIASCCWIEFIDYALRHKHRSISSRKKISNVRQYGKLRTSMYIICTLFTTYTIWKQREEKISTLVKLCPLIDLVADLSLVRKYRAREKKSKSRKARRAKWKSSNASKINRTHCLYI